MLENCFKYLCAIICKNLFYTSLPFHFCVCSCLAFSFAMITLLVGANEGNVGGRPDGGSGAV